MSLYDYPDPKYQDREHAGRVLASRLLEYRCGIRDGFFGGTIGPVPHCLRRTESGRRALGNSPLTCETCRSDTHALLFVPQPAFLFVPFGYPK